MKSCARSEVAVKLNDPAGTRTQDLRIKSPLLYQLSYRIGHAETRNLIHPPAPAALITHTRSAYDASRCFTTFTSAVGSCCGFRSTVCPASPKIRPRYSCPCRSIVRQNGYTPCPPRLDDRLTRILDAAQSPRSRPHRSAFRPR